MVEVASSPFRIERLAGHNRKAFSCGAKPIDRWFRSYAQKNSDREIVAVHLAIDNETEQIAGFYTLCNFTVLVTDLPEDFTAGMPRHPVPLHLLGFLGVSEDYKKHGLGKALVNLAVAGAEEQTNTSASIGVLVHALDEDLVGWYRKIGFKSIPSDPLHLIYYMNDFRQAEKERELREAEVASRQADASVEQSSCS